MNDHFVNTKHQCVLLDLSEFERKKLNLTAMSTDTLSEIIKCNKKKSKQTEYVVHICTWLQAQSIPGNFSKVVGRFDVLSEMNTLILSN